MGIRLRGVATLAAIVIFAGSVGCSSVKGASRAASDAYINALLSLDTEAADALCFDGNSTLDRYLGIDYKNIAVEMILNATHYRFEGDGSGRGEGGTLVAHYTLVMPNVNASIAAAPTGREEFFDNLNSYGKNDVSVSVVLKKISGRWCVMNSQEIADNLYGSLYYPSYDFILDGNTVLTDRTWTSTNEDGSFLDTQGISCHYDLSDEYLSSGVNHELSYEYYRNNELIYEGIPVYDEDGNGVSFPLNVADTSLDFDCLPEYDYRLVVLNHGRFFYEDHKPCSLSSALFPDDTAIDNIVWQYTDSSGIYYNPSSLVAKIWLNDRYIDSGRSMDLTFDIYYGDELIISGADAEVFDGIAVCTYSEASLESGDYTIIVYNNGSPAGEADVGVIINLDPDRYSELISPDAVTNSNDEDNATLEIYTDSRTAIDIANDYTDVDFDYTTLSMNIFADRLDSVLASGEDAPDIIICDSSYVRRYAMSDMTVPLNDIGISYSELQYMYEYIFALTADENSVIKGATWEVTPGAVFYCRSAMMSEMGVNEPDDVAPLFSSWDSVLQTARAVNEASGGQRRLFSCTADVEDAYILGVGESWFDAQGNVSTPDYMADFLPFLDALTGEELTFDVNRWSSSWTSRIANRTALAYFGTMRFGELFLRPNHSGDWGIVMPPEAYFDGGNFIFVTSYCDMEAAAADFIRDLTTNENNLIEMTEDGMTVNNISVMMDCAEDDSYCETWLNGQNPFSVFSQVAWNIDASTVTPYDRTIDENFVSTARAYVNGDYLSADDAIAAFEATVEEEIS
ncbi:MAG: carbohydrate ABC transporter substrate-binding protein [Clostridiales bacterium]|nr:carbohydrate ABC transporter substrate-binding protein [Clostridiales bacterium]